MKQSNEDSNDNIHARKARGGLNQFLTAQVNEIDRHRELQIFGIALSFVNLLTSIFWRLSFPRNLADLYPICWPFFRNCQVLHGMPLIVGHVGIGTFAFLSALCAYFFYRSRVRQAYLLLLTLTIIKYFALLLDYRMMGNYHYMPFFVCFFFLFIPGKSVALRILITLFYFAAGTLKFNIEWLSGASIGGKPNFLPQILFEFSCAYVVILETWIVWLLWSRRSWLRYFALLQLTLFHAISWYWVGYFYPLIMAALLSIFPLSWGAGNSRSNARLNDFKRDNVICRLFLNHPRSLLSELMDLNSATSLSLLIYVVFQCVPHLTGSDSALNGKSRILSLNMYDARSVCTGSIMLHYKDENGRRTVEYRPELHTGVRIHCDPIVFAAEARNLCRDQIRDQSFLDLDLFLVAKRTTGHSYTELLRETDFCQKSGLNSRSELESPISDGKTSG